ncbi:hypothetical protein PCASD_10615 [Puccinia coronata f. sp. avenae]|uniref:Secreted protein n=1 Tax=Puccinia coronata f. sp. avenae TaxID=200324 RepID=A0A2N5S1F8_9BASI|nr:hypothetical protein PCASD_21158 [Puccinia coronata f. sp. avenae]PLW34342.1 hypothetical protein PCASD_10615 [Puccinia coronata f. sp. avenae]
MNRAALFLLLALFIAAAKATVHTTCWNYFMNKDGCVFSSADSKTRCNATAKPHPAPVSQFGLVSQQPKKDGKRLARRYDTTEPTFPVAGGKGNCGFYDTNKELGVCLWSGAEQQHPTVETAGWLNVNKTSNCGKRVYIQRTGKPETVQYAKVLDGCSFNTVRLDVGCFQVGLTIKLFNLFNPTKKEQGDQLLYGGLSWDFDNLNGTSTQQGPV